MSIVKLEYKDLIKPIAICTAVIIGFFTTYYYTKGGFFDGILLTIVGISSMFFVLVLSVLVFKILSNLLVNNSYRILGAVVSFLLTIGFTISIIIGVFKLVAGKLEF